MISGNRDNSNYEMQTNSMTGDQNTEYIKNSSFFPSIEVKRIDDLENASFDGMKDLFGDSDNKDGIGQLNLTLLSSYIQIVTSIRNRY